MSCVTQYPRVQLSLDELTRRSFWTGRAENQCLGHCFSWGWHNAEGSPGGAFKITFYCHLINIHLPLQILRCHPECARLPGWESWQQWTTVTDWKVFMWKNGWEPHPLAMIASQVLAVLDVKFSTTSTCPLRSRIGRSWMLAQIQFLAVGVLQGPNRWWHPTSERSFLINVW